MKKITVLVLVLLVALSSISVVAAETKGAFGDVKNNHWAKAQIETATRKGYVIGYQNGMFQPTNEVTRAEFTKMMVNALKLPHSQSGSPWYQPYVAVAFEMKLLNDTDSKEYSKPISRIEIMRIISRSLSEEEAYRVYLDTFKDLRKGDLPFQDADKFQSKDLPSIALMFGTEIVNGFPNQTMGLHKTTTRAEVVVMIENWLNVREVHPTMKLRLKELKEIVDSRINDADISK